MRDEKLIVLIVEDNTWLSIEYVNICIYFIALL